MTISITVQDGPASSGNKWASRGIGNLGVYAGPGGVSYTPDLFGFNAGLVEDLDVRPAGGYTFEVDYTNKKIKARRAGATSAASPLVLEEAVTVASNVATLVNVPGYILAVHVTAGGVTGAFRVIPVGKTPTTKQVAVNLLTGAMTFLGTDAVTACKVTYIPLGVGPFVEANRVIDEAVVLAAAGVNLANQACLIQYAWNDTAAAGNRLPALIPVGEAPAANQMAIDVINGGNTTLTVNAAQDTNAGLVTYWKKAAFVQFGFVDQADIAVTGDAIQLNEVLDIPGYWIPCFGNVIVGETGAAANLQSVMEGPSGAVAANVAVLDSARGKISFANGDAYATIEMAYVVLDSAFMSQPTPAGGLVEVANGVDLSAAVFNWRAIGF